MKKPAEQFERKFIETDAWGLLTSIDIHQCNPDYIRSRRKIKEFVIALCHLIKMKRYQEPVIVHFGKDKKVAGYSMTQFIETSLISAHFANQTNHLYLDIFSCKSYNPKEAAEFSRNFFQGKDYTLNTIYRK